MFVHCPSCQIYRANPKTVVMNIPNMAVQKWLWAAHDIKPVAVPLGLNGRKPGGQMNLHPVGEWDTGGVAAVRLGS